MLESGQALVVIRENESGVYVTLLFYTELLKKRELISTAHTAANPTNMVFP